MDLDADDEQGGSVSGVSADLPATPRCMEVADTDDEQDWEGGPEKSWSGHWSCFGHTYAIEASFTEEMLFIRVDGSAFHWELGGTREPLRCDAQMKTGVSR